MKKIKTNTGKGFNGTQQMRCPYCGSPAHLRSADGIYKENKDNVQLYVCAKYPQCDSYVRVHPGTTVPVGSLANAKLRTLRLTAHRHFNKLYDSGLMSKDEAYRWLAYMIQSPLSQAHIGYQSEYYCNLIIKESDKLFENMSWKLKNKSRLLSASGGEHYAAQ